jgi:hypothetical protein
VAADGAKAGQVLRVTFPRHAEDPRDGDAGWLRQLTERHGGRYPDTVMNSLPSKVDLWFADAASEEASAPTSVRKADSRSENGSPSGRKAALEPEGQATDFASTVDRLVPAVREAGPHLSSDER